MRLYRVPLLRPLFLLWWRLRERDVRDLGLPPPATDTYGSPSYEYGKVTGLVPDLRVITETTESPYVCCGYCSAGMACWTAKTGITHSMSGAAHPIRSASGRPHDNGSKASELRNGAKSAHGVTFDALARDEIPGVLRAGFAVVINLDYADLPGYLKVQSGSFGHSCTLYGWKESGDYLGFFDPLWPEGAYGAWARWADVKPALWADGEHSATVTSSRPPAPPEPEPKPPAGDCEDCPELDPGAFPRAEAAAVELERDRSVGEWVAWLGAGAPLEGSAYDVGAWAPVALELDDLLEAGPCRPGPGAVWSRGPLPDPVAAAHAALVTPALWDAGSWRGLLWHG